MGKSWPLLNAQPLGGKLKLTIFISLRNGSDISLSLADVLRERVLRLDEAARAAPRLRVAFGAKLVDGNDLTWVRPWVGLGGKGVGMLARVEPFACPLSEAWGF